MNPSMTIGAVARMTGCNVRTIRYYESIGLLPTPDRSSGNQRLYETRHVDRLAFIRRARDLGFPLEAVRELLDLADGPERSCASIDAAARRQSDAIGARIAKLERLKAELDRMIAACAGGRVADCRILKMLGDDLPR